MKVIKVQKEDPLPSKPVGAYDLKEGSANKGPKSEYFRHRRPSSLCHCSTKAAIDTSGLQLLYGCSKKTLVTKVGGGPDEASRP